MSTTIETGPQIPREQVCLWLTNSSSFKWIATPLYRRRKPSELGDTFHDDVWLLLAAKVGNVADRFINVYTFWFMLLLTTTMIVFRGFFTSIVSIGAWGGVISTLVPLFFATVITSLMSSQNHKVAMEIQRCQHELAATVMNQGYALTIEMIKPRNCMVQHNYVLVLRPVDVPNSQEGHVIIYPCECLVTIEGLLGLFSGLAATLLLRIYF